MAIWDKIYSEYQHLEQDRYLILLWLLFLVFLPPFPLKHRKENWRIWDRSIVVPAKRLYPTKYMRKRFDLPKETINIVSWIRFFIEFWLWIGLICLTAGCLLLPFKIFIGAAVCLCLSTVLLCLHGYCILTVRIINGIRTHKQNKQQAAESKATDRKEQSFLRKACAETRTYYSHEQREQRKQLKELLKFIYPCIHELERYTCRKRGVIYLPTGNIKHVEKNLMPRYPKLRHDITYGETGESFFVVTVARDGREVHRLPIKQ